MNLKERNESLLEQLDAWKKSWREKDHALRQEIEELRQELDSLRAEMMDTRDELAEIRYPKDPEGRAVA